jgi:hypothetical protein
VGAHVQQHGFGSGFNRWHSSRILAAVRVEAAFLALYICYMPLAMLPIHPFQFSSLK